MISVRLPHMQTLFFVVSKTGMDERQRLSPLDGITVDYQN
jgi:hypothetical protein